MIANGKILFALGCPQAKIKFLVGQEFESEDALKKEIETLSKPIEKVVKQSIGRTFSDWILSTFKHLPMMKHGELPVPMSKSELRRIMDGHGLEINGGFPDYSTPLSDITFPIQSFVWFPKSKKRRTTWY